MEKKSSSDRNSLEYKWKVRASASVLLALSFHVHSPYHYSLWG